jgi:hypothetical protein
MTVYRPKTRKISTAGETKRKPLLFLNQRLRAEWGFEVVKTRDIGDTGLQLLYEVSHGQL